MTAPASPIATQETEHELKVWPKFFEALLDGRRSFEVRRDDRGFKVGDTLRLREWLPATEAYTGRETRRRIVYLTTYGADAEFAMSIDPFVVLGLVDPEALSSAERRNEELARERDEVVKTAAHWVEALGSANQRIAAAHAAVEASKATIASLTGQVGEMREKAADRARLYGAGYMGINPGVVAAFDQLAADIRALAPSPPGISTTGGDGWLPIETNPPPIKTPLLVGRSGSDAVRAAFIGGRWKPHLAYDTTAEEQMNTEPWQPTHWRPLPRPPGEPEA